MGIIDRKYGRLQRQIIKKSDWQLEFGIYRYPIWLIHLLDRMGPNKIYGVLFQ